MSEGDRSTDVIQFRPRLAAKQVQNPDQQIPDVTDTGDCDVDGVALDTGKRETGAAVVPLLKKPQPNKPWSVPIDCLEEAIADIKAGRIEPTSVFIGFHYSTDTHESFPYYSMGLNLLELRGLLVEFLTGLGERFDKPA